MDRKSLICLAIVVAGLMVLILMVGESGLPSGLVSRVRAEGKHLADAESTFQANRRAVDKALADEPELFKSQGVDQSWPTRLNEASARLDAAKKKYSEAKTLLDANDAEQAETLAKLLREVSSARTFASSQAAELSAEAKRWVDLKTNLKKNLASMEETYAKIQAFSLAQVESDVAAATVDWPLKKTDLDGRVAGLKTIKQKSTETWTGSQAAREKGKSDDVSGVDFKLIQGVRDSMQRNLRNLQAGARTIQSLCKQLYWSYDKMLIDMEIREGRDVAFYHRYRTVRTQINPEKKEPEVKSTESETKVSKSQFEKMKDYLGMVVEHKSAGKYDHEAEKVVQPPGFAYMAPKGQKNQYGEWRRRRSDGTSFWVFYGQYALMRDLFWGPSYGGWISGRHYDNYRDARRSGRTYYATDNAGKKRFGSSGTYTKSRYANTSKYVKTGGYKNSRYVKSGGTYRGSRYDTRSRSYSSSRSSTSRSSGRSSSSRSRSWGSRSFGGSRFRGGK